MAQDSDQPIDPNMTRPRLRRAVPRTLLRIAVVIMAAIALNGLMAALLSRISEMNSISGTSAMSALLVIALLGYAFMIALPFMPGIEIGIALLLLQGAAIAPFVYVATCLGLFAAYLVGAIAPLSLLHSTFRDLHMRRACELIADIEQTPKQARLSKLRDRVPRPLSMVLVNYRYVTLAVLLNIPGSFAIGGGGGIMMMAGLLRLFHWTGILATLAIATLPIPLIVFLVGADGLTWFPS